MPCGCRTRFTFIAITWGYPVIGGRRWSRYGAVARSRDSGVRTRRLPLYMETHPARDYTDLEDFGAVNEVMAEYIPEPFPALPECTMLECSHPDGWSCFLDPGGGATWFANTPNDCIPAGSSKAGFDIVFSIPPNVPDFCCYLVQFTDPTGAVILEQEECFTCEVVSVEYETWGLLKALYR